MTFIAALATAMPAPARTRVTYLHANGTACESYACQLASHHDTADVDATHGAPLVAGADYTYAARPARRRA